LNILFFKLNLFLNLSFYYLYFTNKKNCTVILFLYNLLTLRYYIIITSKQLLKGNLNSMGKKVFPIMFSINMKSALNQQDIARRLIYLDEDGLEDSAHQLANITSIKNLKADLITKQVGLFTYFSKRVFLKKTKRDPETSSKNLVIIILIFLK